MDKIKLETIYAAQEAGIIYILDYNYFIQYIEGTSIFLTCTSQVGMDTLSFT